MEKALGNGAPDVEPRATGTIEQIIALIGTLVEQGNAYHVPGGDVYFAINTCQDYGKLSGRKPDELRAGERIAVCLLYTSPSPRDGLLSRMPSSA